MRTDIIIVTFNGAKWLDRCISSALKSNCNIKLVIVDNGSTDNSIEIIRNYQEKRIYLIQSKENLGFGKANNLGLIHCLKDPPDYIYLLNQDAYLEDNTVSELIKLAEKDCEYGILSPMQFNGKGNQLDKNFAYIYHNRSKKSTTLENVQDAEFVMAAHWLIPINVINKLGLFNPLFIHYGEDSDFAYRVLFSNYKIGIACKIKAYHDRENRNVAYWKLINQAYMNFLVEIINPFEKIKTQLYLLFKFIIRSSLHHLLRFQFKIIPTHLKNIRYLLNNYSSIKKSRKENRRKRRIEITSSLK